MNLDNYKEAFLKALIAQLNVYVTVGTPILESPMWFQFGGIKNDELTFTSSQNDYMFFNLPLNTEDTNKSFDFSALYEYFRNVKYDFIKEKYPTVYKEIKG